MTRLSRGRNVPSNVGRTSAEGITMAGLSKKSGKTRGKNPRDIEYDAFDVTKPETLPKSLKEFMESTGTKSEVEVLEYCIDGFNQSQYAAASDEIGEFINDAWDKDTQAQFRLAVRNYSKLTASSIDDAVALIKPGVEKAWAVKVTAAMEAAKLAAAKPATV